MMQTNEAGRNLIKRFESLRLEAYKCPAGVWTIGYGHTRDPFSGKLDVKPGNKLKSEHEADELLKLDLERSYEPAVAELCPGATENQFAALVSFTFNLGVNALTKSTLRRKFLAGDIAGAADEFLKWNKAAGKVLNGLVKRRAAERELFLL
jgi:lysozyme